MTDRFMNQTSHKCTRFQYIVSDVREVLRRLKRPDSAEKIRRFRERPVTSEETVSLAPIIARKVIFVHVPKCAGITVNRTLYGCRGAAHLDIAGYKHYLTLREFDSFFKFTFVRNPWDRVVSAYHFLMDGGLHERDRRVADATVSTFLDFPSFVEGFIGEGRASEVLHLRPQHSFLTTGGGAPEVDFVGRFETLNDDFSTVCQNIGIGYTPARKNSGKSRPRDWRKAYNDRTAEIVADAYARDIELFGYSFER